MHVQFVQNRSENSNANRKVLTIQHLSGQEQNVICGAGLQTDLDICMVKLLMEHLVMVDQKTTTYVSVVNVGFLDVTTNFQGQKMIAAEYVVVTDQAVNYKLRITQQIISYTVYIHTKDCNLMNCG